MKISNKQLQEAHAAAMRIPFKMGDRKLSGRAITDIILLRVALDKHYMDLERSRRIAFESAKEGIEGYDEGINAYLQNPDEHEDFKQIIRQVEQRFIPALESIMKEEVDIIRPMSVSTLLEICDIIGDTSFDFSEEKSPIGIITKPELLNPVTGTTEWTAEEYMTLIASTLVAYDNA